MLTVTVVAPSKITALASTLGGGGILVVFVVRGRAIFRDTVFKPLPNYGYHFHNFQTPHRSMGVSPGDFPQLPDLWPRFPSICGIMALKSTRIYGIVGTNFLGKMASPRQTG